MVIPSFINYREVIYMTKFKKFYLCPVIGVLMASFYPLYMGVRIVKDMV